jgi:hypothetical protein
MKDIPEQISPVMNLILPITEQLPTGQNFTKEYFNETQGGIQTVKPSMIEKLKNKFKGRTSYLKSMQTDVVKKFIGNKLNADNNNSFTINKDVMRPHQSEYYLQAFNESVGVTNIDERKGRGKEAVYTSSRQAVLFVYPDGSYGEKGFKKYIKTASKIMKKNKQIYVLGKNLKIALNGATYEDKLKQLEHFSSKYASTIRGIIKARKERKSVFVYCFFVKGSGAILFSLILELFGFSKFTYTTSSKTDQTFKPASRYALLTKDKDGSTDTDIKNVIRTFNKPDNSHGEIINVIIGSKVLGEGFSLKNVQEEYILTPFWNYTETIQAIGRGYRLYSHKDLINEGIIPELKVYQQVSIPNNGNVNQSIDYIMYRRSQIKDINIKHIERYIMESSFDCSLNYNRNHIVGYDNQRECEYKSCDWKCDGGVDINTYIENNELDQSTYQLYYVSKNVREIIQNIVFIFNHEFKIHLTFLTDDVLPQYTEMEIIIALKKIIDESIVIKNKYGFPSYLKEENNIFFLVDSLTVTSGYFSEYYTSNMIIKQNTDFNDILNTLYYQKVPYIIETMCSDLNIFNDQISMLPIRVQALFLENALLANKQNINTPIKQLVLNYYKDFFITIDDNIIVSTLLVNNFNILRCLKNFIWEDCDEEYNTKFQKDKEKKISEMEENKYGYYGQYNPNNEENFCLKSTTEKSTGKICSTWKRTSLVPIIVDVLKIPIPHKDENFSSDSNLIQLKKQMKDTVKNKELYNKYKDESMENIKRLLYWNSTTKSYKNTVPILCQAMRDWFTQHGLIQPNSFCGTHTKQ